MTRTDTVDTSTAGLNALLRTSPYNEFLGLTCTAADAHAGRLVLEMPLRPELARIGGEPQFHGGPVASLIDTAAVFATILASGVVPPTVNLRVDYLRPSSGTLLVATATVRRAGRSVGVADVDVTDDQGRLTAIGRATLSTATG
ncbi:PaaI family thioesterase [Pimelobacter simplex]|uniref:PaaI family thioesterase n=1 Tax=Nocardioides simplex TaxID=2045 RepID=A0A7J5E424_NOCSI|nr:PaaI family thioesterase [Pimelobacter simplex]KAB2812684.1 PaaI family thioesterase [Pimelobacter simplex]